MSRDIVFYFRREERACNVFCLDCLNVLLNNYITLNNYVCKFAVIVCIFILMETNQSHFPLVSLTCTLLIII